MLKHSQPQNLRLFTARDAAESPAEPSTRFLVFRLSQADKRTIAARNCELHAKMRGNGTNQRNGRAQLQQWSEDA